MSYEVKFGFATGHSLVFSAFQPSGAGRGLEQQPLPEIRAKGYYVATPITSLVASDMVLAYELENVYWEDDLVYILSYENVFYEGARVYYEEDWVMDFDSTFLDEVTSTDDPIGVGEYGPDIVSTTINTDLTTLQTAVDDLVVDQNKVLNVYDERPEPEAAQMIIE